MTAPDVRYADRVSERGIAYRDTGDGSAIVLLHGWCLDRRTWLYQEEALAATHRVIAPDLPGFGLSRGLAGPYTLGRYVDELAGLLAELDVRDATVVGFAFGAAVAMQALADGRGERIGRLAAIGVPSAATAPYDRMPRSMRRDWPDFARRSAQAIVKYPPSQTTVDWLADIYAAAPLPVALAVLEILARFEPLEVCERVAVPTLLIHGADDDIVPPSVSVACAAAMPTASVAMVEQSGHLAILDQPARVTALIEEFAAT